jgi:hypothetical protein
VGDATDQALAADLKKKRAAWENALCRFVELAA